MEELYTNFILILASMVRLSVPLIFTALAELSTRQIAETTDATGMKENQTGKSVVTGENYLPPVHPEEIPTKDAGDPRNR
jgi:hypothetical protein